MARLLALLIAIALASCTATTRPDAERRASPSSPTRGHVVPRSTPPVTPPPTTAVRLDVGEHLQSEVDRHPPGTLFIIASGVHRGQQIVPRSGDWFRGETGAVLSGAVVLEGFVPEAGLWVVEGQTQEGFVHGQVEDGREVVRHPEDLWIDDERLQHVASRARVAPGAWHFDYARDQIWIGEDPDGRVVETSVESFAFVGSSDDDGAHVEDVTIENVVVERYANRAQRGAINPHDTFGWTVRDCVVRENHSVGIGLGPGIWIEGCDIHDNGQVGIAGSCSIRKGSRQGESAPVTIRGNRIHGNGAIGFDTRWEAGGAKVKFCVAGVEVTGNWVHENAGPGLWFDVDNFDATVADNIVEENEGPGIFYEISFGDSTIRGNHVRGNGRDEQGGFGAGVFISNSADVEVVANLILDQPLGVYARDTDRGTSAVGGRREVRGLEVRENVIEHRDGTGMESLVGDASFRRENVYRANTYILDDATEATFLWGGDRVDFAAWQALGNDRDGRVLPSARTEAPPRPPGMLGSTYRAAWTVGEGGHGAAASGASGG